MFVELDRSEEERVAARTDLSLVVMAAGVGSRFGGLKQLEAVGPSGEIILDYSIHDALRAGIEEVVFIIRREMEREFREVFGRAVESKVATHYVYQELDALPEGLTPPAGRVKPWGTGQAILCAREAVSNPFVVINADDFYGPSSFGVLADWLRADRRGEREWCMAGYRLGNTLSEHGSVSRGVCQVRDGLLVDVTERLRIERRAASGEIAFTEDEGLTWHPLDADTVVSMNMFGFTPTIFDELEARFRRFLETRGQELESEFYIPTVVMECLEEGAALVTVLPTMERWVGMTHREDLPVVRAAIEELVAAGVYPSALRKP
jgi:hypothetical protein